MKRGCRLDYGIRNSPHTRCGMPASGCGARGERGRKGEEEYLACIIGHNNVTNSGNDPDTCSRQQLLKHENRNSATSMLRRRHHMQEYPTDGAVCLDTTKSH